MTDLANVWRACRVRRWHTNTELAGTDDRIDGHSGRVARIIFLWHPNPSVALIKAALIHDDGEWGVGDIAQPVKQVMRRDDPTTWAKIEALEDGCAATVWGALPTLNADDARWLKLADGTDAVLWAWAHGARLDRNGWPELRAALFRTACELGVGNEFQSAMEAMD